MINKISVYGIKIIDGAGKLIGKLRARHLVFISSQDRAKGRLMDGREVFKKDGTWFYLAE